MAQVAITQKQSAATEAAIPPQEVANHFREIERYLEAEKPEKALEVVRRSRVSSPWMTHAAGVCQLRLGNAAAAITAYRGLVLTSGVNLRDEVPAVFKLNFAIALLLDGNVRGFDSAIAELRDQDHPTVRRYREAVQAWKQSWPWWRRALWSFIGPPAEPFSPEFPLGELR